MSSCTLRCVIFLPFISDGLKILRLLQDNAGVIVNPKGEMKGSAITGPVAKECVRHAIYLYENFVNGLCSFSRQICGRVSHQTLEQWFEFGYLSLMFILYPMNWHASNQRHSEFRIHPLRIRKDCSGVRLYISVDID